MQRTVGFNDVLAFALEIGALILWALLLASLAGQGWLRIALPIAALAVLIFIWGRLLAPNAAHRLAMPWLAIAKLAILLTPALYFVRTQRPALAIGWALLVIAHIALGAAQKSL